MQRILLGMQLRRLREARNITRTAAARAIRSSEAKICRIELGRVGSKEQDVAGLLAFYGVKDPQVREEFLALARRTNTSAWWRKYGDLLPSWFDMRIGLEEAASSMRIYEVQFIPGLLQTADYAQAAIRLGYPTASEEENARRVELRMARQKLLTRPDAPKLWVVLDEAALRRPIGGAEVLRHQLRHLLEVSDLPNVTLQVIPFRISGYAAAGGPITIMRFGEPDLPDIVYLEQLSGATYLEKPEDVENYKLIMDRLSVAAEWRPGSMALIERIIKEI